MRVKNIGSLPVYGGVNITKFYIAPQQEMEISEQVWKVIQQSGQRNNVVVSDSKPNIPFTTRDEGDILEVEEI